MEEPTLLFRLAQRPQATRMTSLFVKAAVCLDGREVGFREVCRGIGFGRRRVYLRVGEVGMSMTVDICHV